MAEFVKIGTRAEMPRPGEAREFNAGSKVICVANVDGEFSAMDNVCLHRGGPLGTGVVMDGKVICPWHGWAWNPKTGEAAHNPQARMQVYPLKLEGDDVLVQV